MNNEMEFTPEERSAMCDSIDESQNGPDSTSKAVPPQRGVLVHETREMLANHIAKYNDPYNLEWDWEDVHDKWKRHAYNAFTDLQAAEAEIERLSKQLEQHKIDDSRRAKECLCFWCGEIFPMRRDGTKEEKADDLTAHAMTCVHNPCFKQMARAEAAESKLSQLQLSNEEKAKKIDDCWREHRHDGDLFEMLGRVLAILNGGQQ